MHTPAVGQAQIMDPNETDATPKNDGNHSLRLPRYCCCWVSIRWDALGTTPERGNQ
jgi:hypothetical protein